MDPALLFLTEIAFPPSRPSMVEERLMLSAKGEAAQKLAERISRGFEAYAMGWKERLRRGRADYATITTKGMTGAEANVLDELIDNIEKMADWRARDLAQLRKQSRRDIRTIREPSVAAVSREFARSLDVTDVAIIEELLDFALFLRAVRAERKADDLATEHISDAAQLRAALRRRAA